MSSIKIKDMIQKNSTSKGGVKEWLKTTRIQTALVTSLSLWAGYITVSDLDLQSAVFLGAMGILFHVFGFTLNEVKDSEYDAKINNGSNHPIALGKVNKDLARYVAWYALLSMFALSTVISLSYGYSYMGVLMLVVAVFPAYLYNEFSKTHWWSNIYLSMWVFAMVLSGSFFASEPNQVTLLVGLAIAIQIFVQVIEGDLKDLTGKEASICDKLGVEVKTIHEYINQATDVGADIPEKTGEIVVYNNKFTAVVYGLKLIELGLLLSVVYVYGGVRGFDMILYTSVYFTTLIIFTTSMNMILVYVYNRDRIKKASSLHELSAIVLIGLSLYPFSQAGAVLVAVGPILWYIFVNGMLYSDILNPDV